MRSQLNTVDIPDQTSIRMINYYPTFDEIVGKEVKMGFEFTYKDKMYKTVQPILTIQKEYTPGIGTESLHSRIDLEHTLVGTYVKLVNQQTNPDTDPQENHPE